MTLLMWRNHFTCDIFAENGSAHISSLCKWGPSEFTHRTRILPSGRPPEESVTLVQDDPTWALEYAHFKTLCAGAAADRSVERHLAQSRAAQARRRDGGNGARVMKPVIGFAGMTHLGLVSASAAAATGLSHGLLRSPTRR